MLGEILTASVTPFDANGAVNLPKFRELAAFLVENGSDGLVVTGTTGESPTLTDDERFSLYSTAVETIGDRATVIAGTGTYDTRHSVHLTAKTHELGVDGFLIVTPYYNKPPPRGIVEHMKAIAAVTDKPIVYYNIPGRVVNLVSVETLAELAEIPNVVARQAGLGRPRGRTAHRRRDGPRALRGGRQHPVPVPRARRHRWDLRPHAHRRPAGQAAAAGLPCRRRRAGPGNRRGARARLRDPRRHRRPDRDQGRAEPPRARRRRPSPANGRGDRRGKEHDPRLPAAARRAPTCRGLGSERQSANPSGGRE